jgi:hypothetical protein
MVVAPASLGTDVLAEVILASHGVILSVVAQAVHIPILAGKVGAVLAVAVAARIAVAGLAVVAVPAAMQPLVFMLAPASV